MAEALLGLTPFAVSTIRQRINYFRKIESNQHSLVFSAYVIDRCYLLQHEIGVSYNFVKLQKFFGLSGFDDYFSEPIVDLIVSKELEAFRSVLFRAESSIFWVKLEENGRIPIDLSVYLSTLQYEETRIVFLFLGNLLRWSALTQPSEGCFLCGQSMY